LPPSRKYEEEDFMKKLVAISVLFAGLATAVFAQSGGWSNEWKIGFGASFQTDMFYTHHTSGKSEATQDTTPVTPSDFADDGTHTWSKESGKYSKGATHFFPNADPFEVGDNAVFVRLENSGENYAIRFNFGIKAASYNSEKKWAEGIKLWDILQGGTDAEDWGVKANVGIFSLGIGPWATEAAWVDANATWSSSSWLGGWASYNRYGVWRTEESKTTVGVSPTPDSWKTNTGFVHSNHFRTFNRWGNPFSVGIKLGDQFKFTLGYNFDPFDYIWGQNPNGSREPDVKANNRSSINGAFMFSGSPADAIAFDVFYAIVGVDLNNLSRTEDLPTNVAYGYKDPQGKWNNVLGAYVQVKGIENLFLSVGYTASFTVFEAGAYMSGDSDFTQSKAVNYNAPIFSGIDLRLGYSGIDKIGLKFNNNFSFAGVNGDDVPKDTTSPLLDRGYKDKINLLFNEDPAYARANGDGLTQSWFHWTSRLEVGMNFIDGVPLQLSIGNLLGVTTNKLDRTRVVSNPGDPVTLTQKTEGTRTVTNNVFQVGFGARYGMGGVTLGVGLELRLTSDLVDDDKTVTNTSSLGGTPQVIKTTEKSNTDKVEFGIPILFSLSF